MQNQENFSDSSLNYIKVDVAELTNDNIDLSFSNEINLAGQNMQICCIEMINNNKVFIKYEIHWTIRDLIKAIIRNKEYEKVYPNKEWILDAEHFLSLFDLHLILFRSIKDDIETKIDFNLRIDEFDKLNLLACYKYPFFLFKDNRNRKKLTFDKDIYQKVIESNNEFYLFYQHSLPRNNSIGIIKNNPDVEEYYQSNKRGVNILSRINLDPLISENEKLDWFIYDDESLKFLMDMEKVECSIIEVIKYSDDNNKIYFEDKYKYMLLLNRDYKSFLINLYIGDIIMKVESSLTSTANDLLNKINSKLKNCNPDLCFDPRTKILKVKSLNDYVINLNEPIGKFAYINECIKGSKLPEYRIIDNPFDIKSNCYYVNDDNSRINLFNCNQTNVEIENSILFKKNSIRNFKKTSFIDFRNSEKYSKFFKIGSFNKENEIIKEKNSDRISLRNAISYNKQLEESDPFEEYMLMINNLFSENIKEKLFNYEKKNSKILSDDDFEYNSNSRGRSRIAIDSITANTRHGPLRNLSKIKKKEIIFDFYGRMFEEINQSIPISDINKAFSINLKQLFFPIGFSLNSAFDMKKESFVQLLIEVQVYIGSKPFSKVKLIRWSGYSTDQNPLFNLKLFFDLRYSNLPLFSSIIFKIKLIKHNKIKEAYVHETISWANFRLFDHNKRLKTGMHKINLWNTNFSDDSYYCCIDNPNVNSPNIFFEIESFRNPVIHITEDMNINVVPSNYMIHESDQKKILEILEKTPFEEINNYDREVLWVNRYAITQIPSLLPKLLSCVDYKNIYYIKEMEKILKLAKALSPVQALELLTGNYLHESIRKFAVNCLQQSHNAEIQDYMIQLVQALKYELFHDSYLARYLLGIAIKYPLTLGHNLFWNLRSEMYNPVVQQRFGLYLEVFLNKIGKNIRKIFEDESYLIKSLLKVADIPHDKNIKTNDEKLSKFRDALKSLNQELFIDGKEISMPLDFKMRVKGFITEKCKTMKSKKKPLWLVLKNAEENEENIIVMFKKGDDLRQDILTLQLFRVMNNLWFEERIFLKMSLYNVVSTGYFQGMLEIVKDSETLATIHKIYGGATAPFSNKPLKKWLTKNTNVIDDEYIQNFLLTCVAYCVSTFVLGIGDRHNDNIMIKRNGELFHIDFGHFLGHFKYKYGIKRERAPFVFTKEFRKVLGGKKSAEFSNFKKLCIESYQVLRKNVDVLVTLLRMMLCTGIPELTEKSIMFLEGSLALNADKSEKEVKENKSNMRSSDRYLMNKLDESLSSLSTKLNFAIHVIANK